MKRLLILILLLLPLVSNAQLFKAGFVIGPSLSQIEGDDVNGFSKIGLNAGVVSDIYLHKKWSVSFEFLFAQRGSASVFGSLKPEFLEDFKITLNYIEVPVMVNFHDKNGMTFSGGISYGRLINTKFKRPWGEDETFFEENPPKDNDLTALLGLTYNINRIFGINLRWNYSITPFRFDSESNFRNRGQYNHGVALRLQVLFNALGDDGFLLDNEVHF